MSFSQATITEVFPPRVWTGGQVSFSWTSSSPAGTWYQLYVDHHLAWWGQANSVRLPIPFVQGGGPERIDIGTVAVGEEQTDFSGSLPATYLRRAQITWLGGTFLDPDIAGFRVYGGAAPGAAVNYATALADIAAYPGGILTDGFGLGQFGYGGYGQSAGSYTWMSNPLDAGNWNFAVAPYDSTGNQGTALTTSVAIVAPPLAPGLFGDGARLHYSYAISPHKTTLTWNLSPT